VPLTTVCFATLAPQFRSGGTSMFNLLRNIGSSIGISVVQALLTRNTQIMHSRLAEHITLYGGRLRPRRRIASPRLRASRRSTQV